MTTQVNFFWAMTAVRNGSLLEPAGSLDSPVKAFEVDGDGLNDPGTEVVIPAGGSRAVYSYPTHGHFDLFVAQVMDGAGFVYYTLGLDSPEDPANDLAASGDHPATTPKLGLSCTSPLVLNSRAVKVNGNATQGYIYTVTIYNDGATPVRLKTWGRGGEAPL